jgi:hypothetical protein
VQDNNKIHFLDNFLLGGSRYKFFFFVAINTVLIVLIEHIWLSSLVNGSYGIEVVFVLPTITWFALLVGYRKLVVFGSHPSRSLNSNTNDHRGTTREP